MPGPALPRSTSLSLAATLAFVWLGCLAYVVLEQAAGLLTVREFDVDPWRRMLFITLFHWLPWLVLAPAVALVSSRFPIKPSNWRRAVAMHVLALIGLSFAHGTAAGVFYHYSPFVTAEMATFQPWQHGGHFLFGEDDLLLFDLVVYTVFAASLNIRNFHRIVRQNELDAARLQQHLTELRYQTLRMQVNPHFLFNVLNSIAVLVGKGETDAAARMIGRLSRFFRSTLSAPGSQWVSLDEELATVREYLGIVKVRFGDRLRVRETCDDGVRDEAVPAMLLQPLVENSVTHGLGRKVGDCELEVTCKALGADRLRIEIRDDGVGGTFYSDPDFEEGVGLANVRARLELLYGAEHAFRLEGEPGRGARVTVELPRRDASLPEAV